MSWTLPSAGGGDRAEHAAKLIADLARWVDDGEMSSVSSQSKPSLTEIDRDAEDEEDEEDEDDAEERARPGLALKGRPGSLDAEGVRAMTIHVAERTETATSVLDTPLGPLTATVGPQGLTRLAYEADLDAADGPATAHPMLAALADDVDRYFAGEPLTFSVPVDLDDVTAFTRQVLCACAKVPYGATTTYGELAQAVGRPGAARAVGRALGSNPVPIVVPCHRVLRGNGELGGYSSGLGRKRFLLALEGKA